jgi:hypothetical protein
MDLWKKVLKKFLGEKKLSEISLGFNVYDFIYIKKIKIKTGEDTIAKIND